MKYFLLAMLGVLSPFSESTVSADGIAGNCDPRAFGAKADGVTKDTGAIQAAIDACAGTGGSVVLQGGTFFTGMIRLKSDLKFVIAPSATLRGTQDDVDYPDTHPKTNNSQLSNCKKALIYAEGAKNLSIEGGGTIDGNGNIRKWVGPTSVNPERRRPMAIFIVQSQDVQIQNLKVRDAAMWDVVAMETDQLTIRNLDIHSDLSGNRDGIDIVDCHHVLIENNAVFSEDDAICLKSGIRRGTEDVLVRNNHILKSTVANGLKLGTASTGTFKNIRFENIDIDNVDKAAMAVESVDGAAIDGVHFKNIRFRRAGSGIFVLLGKRGSPPKVGSIRNVTFTDVQGDQMKHSWGSAISGSVVGGITYSPTQLLFRNVQITHGGGLTMIPNDPPEYQGQYPDPNLWGNLPASGYFLRHLSDVTFEGGKTSVFPSDARPIIVQRDVTGFVEK